MLIKGAYKTEKLDEIVDQCERADANALHVRMEDGVSPKNECPEHFTFVCRPLDFVALARDIIKLYKGYEDVHY